MRIGKVKESILKRSVLRQLNKTVNQKADTAGMPLQPVRIRINPVEGWTLAACRTVYGAVNALAADRAEAKALAVTVLMPEGTEEQQLKGFMKELNSLCIQENLILLDGHTAVSYAVKTLVLSVAAIGSQTVDKDRGASGLSPRQIFSDMDIIMTGTAGREGTALLALEREKDPTGRYAQSYIKEAAGMYEDAGQTVAARILWSADAAACCDIREGGVFGALWEMAAALKVGLDIDLKAIPIRQHTIEICEFFDLNPYMLLSGGCLLAVCPDGKEAISRLREAGIYANIIGKTTAGNDRLIRYDTETRYLEPPKMDEIYKIDRIEG